MKHCYKFLLAIVSSAAITFVCTAYFVTKNSTRNAMHTFIRTAVEMESFNDVGRLEAYDFVDELLRKRCEKEALDFINYQRTSLLQGLQYRMMDSESVKTKVMERNPSIGERAIKENSPRGSYTYPKCK